MRSSGQESLPLPHPISRALLPSPKRPQGPPNRHSSVLHAAHHGPPHSIARAPHHMQPGIDVVRTQPVFAIDHREQREERRDDAAERLGGRDHEHDHHLQPRGLLYRGPAEQGAGHHAWDGNDAEHASCKSNEADGLCEALPARTSSD